MERLLGRELRHNQQNLAGQQNKEHSQHQPPRTVGAQMPSHRQVDGQSPEQQPCVIARRVGIGTVRLAPEKVARKKQCGTDTHGAGGVLALPKSRRGEHCRQADSEKSRRRERGVEPAPEKQLRERHASRQQSRHAPHEQSHRHRVRMVGRPRTAAQQPFPTLSPTARDPDDCRPQPVWANGGRRASSATHFL